MTDYTKRTVLEAQAHEMLDNYRDNTGWSSEKSLIATVFKAAYATSLPVARINKISEALTCFTTDLQPALTEAVRAKVLRSRVIRGVRHYELNFAD